MGTTWSQVNKKSFVNMITTPHEFTLIYSQDSTYARDPDIKFLLSLDGKTGKLIFRIWSTYNQGAILQNSKKSYHQRD